MFILVWDPTSYTIKLKRGHSCNYIYKKDNTQIKFIDRLRKRHAVDKLKSPAFIIKDELAKFIADTGMATVPRQE